MLFIEDHLHDFTYAMLSLNKSKTTGFFFFSVGKGRQLLHITPDESHQCAFSQTVHLFVFDWYSLRINMYKF